MGLRLDEVEETYVYLCGIAWQHEIGGTRTEVYSSLEELKELHPMFDECGIVKVKVSEPEWIVEQNLDGTHEHDAGI